jgi:hypothetical protein
MSRNDSWSDIANLDPPANDKPAPAGLAQPGTPRRRRPKQPPEKRVGSVTCEERAGRRSDALLDAGWPGQLTLTALQAAATVARWTLPAPNRSVAALSIAVRAPA